ncbi:MAG: HD domain-containing protein [Ilumatobacteraceae bacterium]
MTQPEIEIRRAWRHAVGHQSDHYVDALLIRYGERHRYYHTMTHIMMVVRHVHDAAAMAAWQPSAQLVAAALYHDAIYDPRASDNEFRSAALAARDLADVGWSGDQCAYVKALILATGDHTAPGGPAAAGSVAGWVGSESVDARGVAAAETAFLLDADLAILGADPRSYQAYANGVRAEYFFVDDTRWRSGRGRVLQDFLDRPRIFATEYMHGELEHRARANIEAELATLRTEPAPDRPRW